MEQTSSWDKKMLGLLSEVVDNVQDIDGQDSQGRTALGQAINGGDEDIVKLILKRGASLWIGTNVYDSPLYNAVQRNNLTWVVRIMMNNDWGMKYDLNKTDIAHGKTILHWAAETGAADLVDELLAAGVDFTIQDVYGETPLHYAAESGHLDIVQRLVQAGADVHVTDYECRGYRTPRDCAFHKGHSSVCDFLASLMNSNS